MSDPGVTLERMSRRQDELARRLARLAPVVARAADEFERSRRPSDDARR
jgi:hypothetical protein